ncbi:MAG: hypothetical protein HY665_01535 [Chloroflexi bacterium]|nr:hypothetical protein [Chloroflexota bacterium]
MRKEAAKLKVTARWQATLAEPSPLWRRLWLTLLANRATKSTPTREIDCLDVRKNDPSFGNFYYESMQNIDKA